MLELPEYELCLLLATLIAAFDLARTGEAMSGYRCLAGARARAEQQLASGQPWAEELLRRYRDLLAGYRDRWGVDGD